MARRALIHITLVVSLSLLALGCGGGGDPTVQPRAGAGVGAVVGMKEEGSGTSADAGAAGAVRGSLPTVLVDVAGFVRVPGVYRLPATARVHEAIAAAGGVRRGASLTGLNRAAPLTDGQQIVVPSTTPDTHGAAGPAGAASSGGGAGGKVSINAADAAALDALPGIGPVTAQRIVDDREANGPFGSVDELDRVSGIGPTMVESLREVATT